MLKKDLVATETLLENLRGEVSITGLDPCTLTAWYHTATVLLNLDETISKP